MLEWNRNSESQLIVPGQVTMIASMPYEGIRAITSPIALGCQTMDPVGKVGQQVSPLILSTAERRWAAWDEAGQTLHAFLNRKKVAGSSQGRKRLRWSLYSRAHFGHGTPYAMMSRLRDIQRERSGRFHVAFPRVEYGVTTDQRRRTVCKGDDDDDSRGDVAGEKYSTALPEGSRETRPCC